MSLDVYLETEQSLVSITDKIVPIREGGRTRNITLAEWHERNPGREPAVIPAMQETHTVFHANITHNLSKMASEAGIYKHLWRPDEIGIERAVDLIPSLETGLELLLAEPDRFQQFNPANGWGTYNGLVDFVQEYLDACRRYPTAKVSVWR